MGALGVALPFRPYQQRGYSHPLLKKGLIRVALWIDALVSLSQVMDVNQGDLLGVSADLGDSVAEEHLLRDDRPAVGVVVTPATLPWSRDRRRQHRPEE